MVSSKPPTKRVLVLNRASLFPFIGLDTNGPNLSSAAPETSFILVLLGRIFKRVFFFPYLHDHKVDSPFFLLLHPPCPFLTRLPQTPPSRGHPSFGQENTAVNHPSPFFFLRYVLSLCFIVNSFGA